MAKGSGMIHPALATMLAVVTTDYPLEPGEAEEFLRPAVETSFNRISVDGECSTNDAVLLLANGASGAPRDDHAFAEALNEVCASLARQVVEDGEEDRPDRGQRGRRRRRAAGRRDRAPGRHLAAREDGGLRPRPELGPRARCAGSAPFNGGFAQLETNRVRLALNGTTVFDGAPLGQDASVAGPSLSIDLDLRMGAGSASYLASDLTYDYVRLNAEYTT